MSSFHSKTGSIKYITILIIFLIPVKSYSQELTGHIINSTNDKPVSFVNVGVVGQNRGTVSDINGKFKLTIVGSDFENDSLRISCVGFISKSYLLRDLLNTSFNKNALKIDLTPAFYNISEVQVRGEEPKLKTLGNPIRDNNNIRIRTYSTLGSEIGLVMHVPKRNRNYKLKEFTFNLADHNFETQVRLNVYNLAGSEPSTNILQEPIYISIPADKEILTVDLTAYNIIVDQDFFIAIENFKGIPSPDKRLKFNGVSGLGNAQVFYRKISQGEWERLELVSIQFKLVVYEYQFSQTVQ